MQFESKRVDIIYYLLLRKQQFAYSYLITFHTPVHIDMYLNCYKKKTLVKFVFIGN